MWNTSGVKKKSRNTSGDHISSPSWKKAEFLAEKNKVKLWIEYSALQQLEQQRRNCFLSMSLSSSSSGKRSSSSRSNSSKKIITTVSQRGTWNGWCWWKMCPEQIFELHDGLSSQATAWWYFRLPISTWMKLAEQTRPIHDARSFLSCRSFPFCAFKGTRSLLLKGYRLFLLHCTKTRTLNERI